MNSQFIEQLQAGPLATVCDYYASCLPDSPKAITYLKRHALYCQALPVGFADRSLGNHIPKRAMKLGSTIRKQLESLGVYRDNGREHFRGMVTVPLHSTTGEVGGIYGRRIDLSNDGPIDQYIGQGIFNAQALQQFDQWIITTTILDAWTFYAAGHTHVICCVDYQLTADEVRQARRVLLAAPDIDCQVFTNCEIHCINFPGDHTANSWAIANEPSADPLGKLIRAAGWQSGASTGPAADLAVKPTIEEAADVASAEPATEPAHVPAMRTPQASPVPAAHAGLDVVSTDTETTITIETRRWRIRGLQRNTVPGVMKVNVMLFNTRSDMLHVDSFDLYHARSRRSFLAEAAQETGAGEAELRSDLGQVLLKLEELQHEQQTKTPTACAPPVSDAEQAAAIELLKSENLLDRILDDFEACGIVGERTGKLVGYLAATSRLLDRPLGLVIQSSSAAGKSSLADAILSFMPAEDRFSCSAMTSQSLYYLGNENLKHKILSVAEEEGVRDASYQLKLLQSEGSLSLISTSKEKGSGRTSTQRYTVEGPVALVMTTTSLAVDPELLNRCMVVSIDESRLQTAAIHAQQRFNETLEGFIKRQQGKQIVHLHCNAQRLLRKLPVFNPYADQLKFIGWETRHRRDHGKYLTLIKSITLLHQYQREIKTIDSNGQTFQYLEVTRRDIAQANHIADWALGRSIDELAEPSRRLLVELYDWLRQQASSQNTSVSDIPLTRRAARESLRWRATQLNYHLERLCRDEYVVRCGGSAGKLCQYQLLYDGKGCEGQPCLLQLVDPSKLAEPQRIAPTPADLSD